MVTLINLQRLAQADDIAAGQTAGENPALDELQIHRTASAGVHIPLGAAKAGQCAGQLNIEAAGRLDDVVAAIISDGLRDGRRQRLAGLFADELKEVASTLALSDAGKKMELILRIVTGKQIGRASCRERV